MNSNNGDLYFQAGIDDSKFNISAEAMEKRVQQMSATVQSEAADMENSIQQFAVKGAEYITTFLVGKGMYDLTKSIVEVRGEFQQLEIAFETMLGSTERANDLMAQLTQTAAKTPFDLKGVANGAKQLLAYGTAAEEVNETLIHLGDIAAGMSIPLNDIVMLYGTTMTQGRMYTQDLRQFMGRGIPIAEELAKQFGVTKDKVAELVTQGKVTSKEFNAAIMAMSSEGGKFYQLMEKQSASLTGQISNLEDAWDMARNNIGKDMEGIAGDAISMATSIVENLEPIMNTIRAVAIAYGSYRAALILNSLATKGETGVALIDNTVKKAKIQLLRLEEKATSGAAERIRELKQARQEEIVTLENQLSAEEKMNLIHQTRIANIGKVLTETQKMELANLGLTESSEDYEKIALSMMSNEQRMAIERGELTNNTGEYIGKLHEAVDAKQLNIKVIDNEIAKTQEELQFAVEYKNMVQEQVIASQDRCKALENEITNLDVFGDTEEAAAKMEELKAEKTKLATLEEELNTAATSVNEKQTNLETLAKQRNAAATNGAALADRTSATAKNLLTRATLKATAAIKTLWAAMKANPLGWILTAVGAVVAIFDRLKTKSEEAERKQKELEEEERRVAKASVEMKAKLDLEIINIEKATGKREEEKKMVQELNTKYGEIFGTYDTLAKWYDTLKTKSEAYVRTLYLQAKIEKAVRDAADVDDALDELKKNPPDIGFFDKMGAVFDMWGSYISSVATDIWNADFGPWTFSDASERADNALLQPYMDEFYRQQTELEQRRDALLHQASEWQTEIENITKQYDIRLAEINTTGGKTVNDLTDKQKRELERKLKLLKDAKDKEVQLRLDAERAVIEAMDEGFEKRMAELEFEHKQELAKIEKDAEELRDARRKAGLGDNLTQDQERAIQSRRDAAGAKRDNARIQVVEEEINTMREKYREYEQWVEMVGQEAADKHFRGLREQGESFSAWLNNRVAELERRMMTDAMHWTGTDQTVYDMFNDATAGADELAYYENLKRAMEGSVSMATNLTAKITELKAVIDKIKKDPKLTDQQRATLGLDFAQQLVEAESENQRRFNETYQMYSKTRRETIAQYQADIDALIASGNTYQAEQVRAQMKRAMGDMDENFLKGLFGEVFSGKATSKAIRAAIKDLNKMKGMNLVTFNSTYNTDFTQEELDRLKEKIDAVNSSLKDMSGYSIADAFKDIRDGRLEGDLERVARGTQYIQNAFQNFTTVVSSLSSALNDLADASDNENLKDTAKTVEKVSNVLSSAGSWAGVGASIGGGWGAAIGAVLGGGLGILTEVLKSEQEAEERIAAAEEAGLDFQNQVSDQLLNILDAVQSLDDTITSLNYDQFREALLGLVNELKTGHSLYQDGKDGKTFWKYLYDSILGNPNNTGSAVFGSGLDSYDIWERFVAAGFISRGEAEERWNAARGDSESQNFWEWLTYIYTFGTEDPTHFDSELMQQNTATSIANYLNWYFGRFAEEQERLIERLQDIYNENSFDSLRIFNAEHDVYKSQYDELDAYKRLYEMLGLTDTDDYRDLLKQMAELEHKMGESLQNMAEGLWGTDIQSIIEDWISIFQEFGDNVDGAFAKIDEGIDKMITNMLIKRKVIEPLLTEISNIFEEYALEVGKDHEYTEDDFIELGNRIRNARGDAYEAYQAYLRALEAAGISIESLTGDTSTLTGSIQNVSEETGGIIAGRMNAIVINQAESTSVLRQSLLVQIETRNYTMQIADDVRFMRNRIGNTAQPNQYLHLGIV